MPKQKPIDEDDNPEWTEADFKKARPASEVLPPEFIEKMAAIRKARLAARNRRGKQKAPTKTSVTLRLDSNIVTHFRKRGRGWQTQINETLKRAVSRAK